MSSKFSNVQVVPNCENVKLIKRLIKLGKSANRLIDSVKVFKLNNLLVELRNQQNSLKHINENNDDFDDEQINYFKNQINNEINQIMNDIENITGRSERRKQEAQNNGGAFLVQNFHDFDLLNDDLIIEEDNKIYYLNENNENNKIELNENNIEVQIKNHDDFIELQQLFYNNRLSINKLKLLNCSDFVYILTDLFNINDRHENNQNVLIVLIEIKKILLGFRGGVDSVYNMIIDLLNLLIDDDKFELNNLNVYSLINKLNYLMNKSKYSINDLIHEHLLNNIIMKIEYNRNIRNYSQYNNYNYILFVLLKYYLINSLNNNEIDYSIIMKNNIDKIGKLLQIVDLEYENDIIELINYLKYKLNDLINILKYYDCLFKHESTKSFIELIYSKYEFYEIMNEKFNDDVLNNMIYYYYLINNLYIDENINELNDLYDELFYYLNEFNEYRTNEFNLNIMKYILKQNDYLEISLIKYMFDFNYNVENYKIENDLN